MRVHVFVSGRVQGVWFRESTRQRAQELGVGGWVRNLPDGRVEALFVGEPQPVREAVAFVRQGPPHASVEAVEIEEADESDEADAPTADANDLASTRFRVR